MPNPLERIAYELAALRGLAYLQRFASLDQLLDHYFEDRHHYAGSFPVNPPPDTVEGWVTAARASAPWPDLSPAIIEEIAFWRRYCQLAPEEASRWERVC